MVKRTIMEQEIRVFAPLDGEAGIFIAAIDGFDFAFRGATAMTAFQRAERWRAKAWNNIVSKKNKVPVPDEPAA
ncbi:MULTISPECIES: hypothetical protein [unclassified Mameliella]|uniref:hypothetical protein n=1 Tax=Mameliella sp. LZ-28 TaxID=2484146 RepID=UPI00143F16AF|nr:hypothetical protein [Mameliella sp. LZ-28]MCR9276216.1 hypothetical protein [Paracoccaceae bacterium]